MLGRGPIPLPPGLEITQEEASQLAVEVRQENAALKDEIVVGMVQHDCRFAAAEKAVALCCGKFEMLGGGGEHV